MNIRSQFFHRNTAESLLDTQIGFDDGPENLPTSLLFGAKLIAARMYQLCPLEDIKLGSMLLRPTKLFLKELANKSLLTKERFGSVERVYIICKEDDMLQDLQEWMIEKAAIKHVMAIEACDHMPMLCQPQMLLNCLLEVVLKYV
ncbi:putative alpha/Beta hydrolase [Dioscorea sansibarensis]